MADTLTRAGVGHPAPAYYKRNIMDNIIEALKKNWYPFGAWPEPDCYGKETGEAMQAKALEIGFHGNFRLFIGPVGWGGIINNSTYTHSPGNTYRLRPDYTEPEAGVEKCEVIKHEKTGSMGFRHIGDFRELDIAPRQPRFIGYLYENGWITSTPRLYVADGKGYPSVGTIRVTVEPETIGTYEVLTPTHVLFRKQ